MLHTNFRSDRPLQPPFVLAGYASVNKVYGGEPEIAVGDSSKVYFVLVECPDEENHGRWTRRPACELHLGSCAVYIAGRYGGSLSTQWASRIFQIEFVFLPCFVFFRKPFNV